MELVNIGLAITAGFLATLAPCAVPLLPSYMAYYLNFSEKRSLSKTICFALITVSGFLLVYLILGVLPSFLVNQIISKIDLVTPVIGAILVFMGIITGFSDVLGNLPGVQIKAPEKIGLSSFFLYGVGYGVTSMSCSFPIFVLLVLQSASAGGPLDVLIMFLAYGLGAATLIVPFTVALSYGKEVIFNRFITAIPFVKKINAFILILAGIYMIVNIFL